MSDGSSTNIVPVSVQDAGNRVAFRTRAWAPLLVSLVGFIPLGIWVDEGMRLGSWTVALAVLGSLMVFSGIWMAVFAPKLYLNLDGRRYLLVRGPRRSGGDLSSLEIVVRNYLSHMRTRHSGSADLASLVWRFDFRAPSGNEFTYWESGDGPATWREAQAWARRIGVTVTDATEFDAEGRRR